MPACAGKTPSFKQFSGAFTGHRLTVHCPDIFIGLARFRSVSKLWASILDSPYFKDLYLTKSLAQPRLIFAIEENVTPEFHMQFPPDGMQIFDHDDRQFSCGYASGLIYFYGVWTDEERAPVICNPKTGRIRTLGTRGMRWRKIGCSLRVEIESEGV
ncbi:hypothetical protein YC2023_094040 [Brassica napus]